MLIHCQKTRLLRVDEPQRKKACFPSCSQNTVDELHVFVQFQILYERIKCLCIRMIILGSEHLIFMGFFAGIFSEKKNPGLNFFQKKISRTG